MPAPYSYDLRQKAMDALERGERKSDICRLLNISRNTLDIWLKRIEEIGDCEAITGFQTGNRHKITDWERFRAFAQEHGDKTQSRMAQLWGDQQNISDALAKIGFSRKKTFTVIKNEMKSNVKHFKRV